MEIPFEEIQAIRIICKSCSAGMELPLKTLGGGSIRCPGCGSELRRADVDEALKRLMAGLMALQAHPQIGVLISVQVKDDQG